MNKLILLFLFLIAFNVSKGQVNALTEDGRQVILFNNGTWKYHNDSTLNKKNHADSIKINPVKFSKSTSSTFLAKSNTVNIGVFIDPDKWTLKTHNENESNPEYRFSLKSGDGYAMLETEKTPIGLDVMRNIALINAQKAAIDAKITTQEYRIVNNKKILFLEMSGTIQGIKFKYMGYYFSNEKGTTQLLSYTTEAMYNEANKELETFLNGLVVID
ncbi:MAG: hypothetical protein JWQ63_3120 [Mucilaginibacter sp.]|jgi:hypothetical protein|nr:hypothetical protein [Mucilaginibacter sp.]